MPEHPDEMPRLDDPETRGTLPAPGTPEPTLPDLVADSEEALAGGRVDAGAAVTGRSAGSSGESPAGEIPGDDASLEGGGQ